jgi:hypothetical protein
MRVPPITIAAVWTRLNIVTSTVPDVCSCRNSIFNEAEGTGAGVADRFANSPPTFEVADHLKLVWFSRLRVKRGVLWVSGNTGGS